MAEGEVDPPWYKGLQGATPTLLPLLLLLCWCYHEEMRVGVALVVSAGAAAHHAAVVRWPNPL